MYRLVAAILLIAVSVGQVKTQIGQTCAGYKGKVIILLDLSETAQTASTPQVGVQKYSLLRDTVFEFSSGLEKQDVQIGIISYSSKGRLTRMFVNAETLSQDLFNLIPDPILTDIQDAIGSSATGVGLGVLENSPDLLDNVDSRTFIVVISGQGSWKAERINGTIVRLLDSRVKQIRDYLNKKGLDFVVIGVGNSTALDEFELKELANGTSNSEYIRTNNYDSGLLRVLETKVKERLCIASTVAPPPPPTQDPNDPCSQCDIKSGSYVLPHPDTCSRYVICTKEPGGGVTSQKFDCGRGTLFDAKASVCVHAKDFRCPAWGQCRAGRLVAGGSLGKLPHLCCGRYWRCDSNDGNVTEVECGSGMIFDQNTNECVFGRDTSCMSNMWCQRGTPGGQCPHTAVNGNSCYFHMNGVETKSRCPPGTYWNQEMCACLNDLSNTCSEPQDSFSGRDNREVCEYVLHVDFSRGLPFKAIDENTKTIMWMRGTDGKKYDLYINTWDTLYFNGAVVFKGAETRDAFLETNNQLVTISYFSHKPFPNTFGMTLGFRFDDQAVIDNEYVLISNDNCGKCQATLRVTATKRPSNMWTFKFWVSDTEGSEAEVSSSDVQIDGNTWYQINVVVNTGTLSGSVTEPSRSQVLAEFGPTITGGKFSATNVMHTKCALTIGQGRVEPGKVSRSLAGAVNDFKFYHDCTSLTLKDISEGQVPQPIAG